MKRILVTGAGGFIGHHLVTALRLQGNYVEGVDLKYPEYAPTDANEFWIRDLRDPREANSVVSRRFDEIYQLAANMGGIGWISSHLADIAADNILINTNMLRAAVEFDVKKYLYTSSACVYAQSKQRDTNVAPLREEDAYPAEPEEGYGWEKLFAEQMVDYFRRDYGLDTRIVRFHNVYGPLGTYDGGKEKSPAALCRKIALAKAAGLSTIEVWGDGRQTRSYMHIDDCVEGLVRLMKSKYQKPLNLGTDELVSINELSVIIQNIAHVHLRHQHNLSKPQGVRGRNSDNTRLREVLGWEPQIKLDEGLVHTYNWIASQVRSK